MVHITKKAIEAYEEFTAGLSRKDFAYCSLIYYKCEQLSGRLLLRFRFALWRMKIFRLFRRLIMKSKTPTAESVSCGNVLPQKLTGGEPDKSE